jgi:5-methylcytosine-specific restriction endonuclease McrA
MEKVLLLNACYSPLHLVEYRRAIVLVLQDKAEIVETGEHQICSANFSMNIPSVIRLNYYVHVPFESHVALNRRTVLQRDDQICQYGCGRKASTVDHVVPRSRGGRHEWLNVLACCSKCNAKKSNHLLSELGWIPLKEPHFPSRSVWLLSGVNFNDKWEPYLASL